MAHCLVLIGGIPTTYSKFPQKKHLILKSPELNMIAKGN